MNAIQIGFIKRAKEYGLDEDFIKKSNLMSILREWVSPYSTLNAVDRSRITGQPMSALEQGIQAIKDRQNVLAGDLTKIKI